MKRLLWIIHLIYFLLILGSCVACQSAPDAQDFVRPVDNADFVESIKSEMLVPYREGGPTFTYEMAKRFAARYGQRAHPVLEQLLADGSVDKRIKGKIAYFIGELPYSGSGEHPAVAPIKALIESALSKPIGKNEQFMVHWSLVGLVHTKDAAALEYLAKVVDKRFWEGKPAGKNESAAKDLREMAINAIGEVGTQQALDLLKKLEQNEAKDLPKSVKSAKTNCEDYIKGIHDEKWKNIRGDI